MVYFERYGTTRTWVSVNFNCFDNCILFDTERYLFFSNSFSKALICAAVKAVLGRFFRSSLDTLVSSSPRKRQGYHDAFFKVRTLGWLKFRAKIFQECIQQTTFFVTKANSNDWIWLCIEAIFNRLNLLLSQKRWSVWC